MQILFLKKIYSKYKQKFFLHRYFSSIAFSADGECILAGGKSQFVCIYHVREGILLKKFEITENHSFDGMDEYVNRKNMTEFGNMALLEEREKFEGGKVAIKLPGAQKGDMASRSFKPEVSVSAVRFSPTGQSWATVCTEGLMIHSLDRGIVFDPFNLSIEVTPKTTKECLKKKEYTEALTMAIKLNENDLIQMVIESIPVSEGESFLHPTTINNNLKINHLVYQPQKQSILLKNFKKNCIKFSLLIMQKWKLSSST